MAEAWCNLLSKNKVKSAALIAHEGKLSWLVIDSSKEFGLDLSNHISKDVTKSMIQKADLIIIMNKNLREHFEKYKKLLKKNALVEMWEIQDIVAKDTDNDIYPEFVKTCKIIGEKVKSLVKRYG